MLILLCSMVAFWKGVSAKSFGAILMNASINVDVAVEPVNIENIQEQLMVLTQA